MYQSQADVLRSEKLHLFADKPVWLAMSGSYLVYGNAW